MQAHYYKYVFSREINKTVGTDVGCEDCRLLLLQTGLSLPNITCWSPATTPNSTGLAISLPREIVICQVTAMRVRVQSSRVFGAIILNNTCDKLTSTDSTSHFIVPLSILLRPQTLHSILAGAFIQENVNIYTALSFVYNIHRCYMQYYDCQFQTRSLVRSSEDASVRILSRGERDV